MLEVLDISILLLILSLLTNAKSTKSLSEQKKCGDPECETSMSRVQAIKDHIGPDCRYLNFKTGEEIIVYFKLSRKREDLWAGSKGQDFGYFPMDTVQIEEVFNTKEIEVPTKETDFLCLDGGEYVFENEDSILNHDSEENEYVPLYTDEQDSDLKMPEKEALKHKSISFLKRLKRTDSDSDEFDSTSKDLYTLETTSNGDPERGHSKIGQVETNQHEDQRSQTPTPILIQPAWTVSGIAGWLGLGSKQNKEPVREISETTEQITFRRRKIAIADDSDLKSLNDESGIEPRYSNWFQSSLTNLLHFRSEKSELGLLSKTNDPEIHDHSIITENADHHDSTTASDAIQEEHSDSEGSRSSWFDLELRDILTFGYSKENKVRREKHAGGEMADLNKEPVFLSSQSADIVMNEGLRKQTAESMLLEEQHNERRVRETPQQPAVESMLHEGQNEEHCVQETPKGEKAGSEVQIGSEHIDFKDAAVVSSLPTDVLKSHYAEQDSVSNNEVMENINIKAIMEESERKNGQTGMTNKGKLRADAPREKRLLNSDNEPISDHHSKANKINPVHIDEKIQTSVKNGQLDVEGNLRESNLRIQNYTLNKNLDWPFQIILHFSDFCEFISSAFSIITSISKKAISVFSEDMQPGPDLYGFPWEMVICAAAVVIFTVLLLMCRIYQSVRSRHYIGRERKLASAIAELVEDKCKLLEKLSLHKKEYEELKKSVKDASLLKGSTDTTNIKTVYEELSSSNSSLKNEIECLEKELEEEKAKRLKQDDQVAEIQRRKESLENEAKSIQLQVAETKTTLKVYEINRERLKTSLQDAIEENGRLHESEKQLLQEAEGWGERFSELNEQKKMFESSKADMEEALKNKESQIKSLTECLLKMKDWSCATGEHDAADDNHWDNDIQTETENGENLEDQDKLTVRKLIYAAKLNACLKSLETERNQIYCKLTDENKAKEELSERIENLQREHVTHKSENTQLENEVQKLQQKLKVMTELYQENEMNLHRKLTVEERERLQKEEKLSKADEKINHAAEELNAYRQQAKDLEEELERTVRSYQSQIMSHEKKAHDNWLTARAAERHLNDIRKEKSHIRQKLTETEFKLDLLEKDPYALDVPVRAFGREHSPYGPSPMSRPSSETRAFLSPPTLLEGPLRLSPVLPGGGGRGSRGPGNTGIYEAGNGRGELNCDRSSDPHRPPSDTGSLSPPWDRDHRIIPPPAGQLYNEQSFPPRRSERFYSGPPNSGRLSGPAELRNYSVHSFDKTDGQPSESNLRMDFSGNGTKDHPSENNTLSVSDQSLAPESEIFGAGIVPPPLPLFRGPLMPMDPRGPFMRRGPPFPPMPPSALYGPHEYFPRDFSSLPRPPLPMRGPFPVRPFSPYPPPRAGFFPPPPLDNRNELPADPTHLSAVSSTDNQESQQKT